jgi:hypothetical protein
MAYAPVATEEILRAVHPRAKKDPDQEIETACWFEVFRRGGLYGAVIPVHRLARLRQEMNCILAMSPYSQGFDEDALAEARLMAEWFKRLPINFRY